MKKSTTPTFLLELPLRVDAGQARRLRAHFEAARCLYNALLGEAMKRLRTMRDKPAWQEARAIPQANKQERREAFSRLRHIHGFSEYGLHAFAREANSDWIRVHIDAAMAQALATRAYRAVNRVCLGRARKVRFRSKGRGLDSVENQWNESGMRFLLQKPEEGPSTIAIVPCEGEAQLLPLCEELKPDARAKRRLQRKLDRQRRANNPQNYDGKGRIKRHGKSRLTWKTSRGYLATRRRLAHKERKLAAHRKSLHGRMVHQIIRRGNTIRTEKLSYRAWQKQYGKSVGRNAPGMLIDHLRRTVASTGGTLSEFPTRSTKLSQYCHGCGSYVKKSLSQRWHHCSCGIGPVQRDLYSAWLAAHLNVPDTIPSIAQDSWEGAELRLLAAVEVLAQRANEGQALPRSVGIPCAGARLPESLAPNRLELVYRRGRLEALG